MAGHSKAKAHLDEGGQPQGFSHSKEYKKLSVALNIKGSKSGLIKLFGFILPSDTTDRRTLDDLNRKLFDGAGVYMDEGYSERNIQRVVAILKKSIADMDKDARAKLPRFIPVILAFDETKVVLNATYDTRTDTLVGVMPKAQLFE